MNPIHAIYVHTFYYDLITPLMLRLFFKIPILIKPPSDFETQQREVFMTKPFSLLSRMDYYGWMKFFNLYLIKFGSIYFQAINKKINQDLRDRLISKENILKLPNGISIERYSRIRKNKRQVTHYGYVGRLLRSKNIRLVLNTFLEYFKICPDDKLFIFGKGPEKIYISKFIKINNLENNIIQWGFERFKEKIYQEIDVLIHPSLGEGCPNTILESILTNTFVIGANVTGIQDIIKKKTTGLLFNPFSAQDLLRCLIYYKNNSNKVSKIIKIARLRVIEKYNVNIVAEQIQKFIRLKWQKKFEKNKLKIAILTPVFPYPRRGVLPGIERYVESLAIPIKELGYDVKIVSCYWNGGTKFDSYKGIPIMRIYDSKRLLGKIGSIFHLNNITFGLNLIRRKHTKFYQDCNLIFMPLALGFNRFFKIKKIPVISGFLHYDQVNTTMEHFTVPFYHLLEKLQFRTHNNIITISNSSKNEIMEIYGIEKEKVDIFPIGINTKKFNPQNYSNAIRSEYGNNILLYVGPFLKRKRIPILLKSMPEVIRKIPDVQLILIGEGLLWDRCKKLAKKLNIEKHAHFLGFVEEQDLLEYYATCDIFVFPSELEGFGQVILEAMASETPVICADKPPMCEIVENGGITFKVNNSEDLSKKIINLLSDTNLLDELRENALKIVGKYNQSEIAKKIMNYFKEILYKSLT